MNDVIAKMREELRLILRDSVADYPTKPREKWLFDWSSQMILVVNQIYWCQEVEQVGQGLRGGRGHELATPPCLAADTC
jgi:dynein heavy chain